MSGTTYDVVILGSGPGGYVAAIRAANHGLKTMLVEEEFIGGVCLNVGCIPSKALIHAGETARIHEEAQEMGIEFEKPTIHFEKMQEWRAGIVSRLTKGVERLVAGNGADIRMGHGRIVAPGQIEITNSTGDKERVQTKNIILATGSRPFEIPGFSFSDERIWDNARALAAKEIPKSLAIIGGGVIGLELGQVYANLGTKVTVVELMNQVLPGTPRDLIQPLTRRLREQKIDVLTETKALGYEESKDGLVLKVEGKKGEQEIPCDNILVTVGRRPNSEELGLENVGLKANERGFLPVNDRLETGAEGIYAIGDLTGAPLLAHRASKQGEVCADIIAGKPAAFDAAAVPAVVYTDPEIASVGLSEEEARNEGYEIVVGKFPFAASGRALSMNATRGFVKVIAERESQAVLGVHGVGSHLSDLIAEGALALEMGCVLEDMAATVHPHPTLSETLMEAALVAMGEAIHVLPR